MQNSGPWVLRILGFRLGLDNMEPHVAKSSVSV